MEEIVLYGYSKNSVAEIPLFTMSVSAGIPVIADSNIDSRVDLNELLVERPQSTFFAKVKGISIKDAGISDGDILIVDSSVEPEDGSIVLAEMGGNFTVKVFKIIEDRTYLVSQANTFLPTKIEGLMEFCIIGSVTRIVHSL
jgi:DNA polymerase V